MKLLDEFVEETGLSSDNCSISGAALILDTNHNVYDIGCKIRLKATRAEILRAFAKSQEYYSPILISTAELPEFVKQNVNQIVPTSLGLIQVHEKL